MKEKKEQRNKRQIIGRVDKADFPIFNLEEILVKIDSGAYTSAIHCSKIKEENGVLYVIFLDKSNSGYTGEVVVFNEFSVKKVRSSSGEAQWRYKVKGNILLFGKKYNTEFTLTKRSKMRYPVLLGRKLLNKKFLIDTSLSNESWKLKEKNNS